MSAITRAARFVERLALRWAGQVAGNGAVPSGWVGPHVEAYVESRPAGGRLVLHGVHHPHGEAHRRLHLRLRVEGRLVGGLRVTEQGPFGLSLPLPPGLLSPVRVEVEAEPFFVPDEHLGNGDQRRLCFVLSELRVSS